MQCLSWALALCVTGLSLAAAAQEPVPQTELRTESLPLLRVEGLSFKDHNRNGSLEPYEDWRLDATARAENLVSLMTLEEKAGAMLHGSLPGRGETYELALAEDFILQRHINSMISRLVGGPAQLATENNKVQRLAEGSRLGIPLTISTDPRHHFQFTEGASVANGNFSQWPETLGFAALRDASRVREFADIARREYRAVGIHMGLSPQADLATEPRWPRINGTFGEDAQLAKALVQAYVEGFQNGADGLGEDSVALVVKHWAGYGAAENGYDSHNYYGRFAVFPGGNFDYHLIPFKGAFTAGVAGVMPTYSILRDLELQGREIEQVGAGFNRFLLTDLLRGQYDFDGLILSDWAITRDCPEVCLKGEHEGEIQSFGTLSTAWGVLDLSMAERFVKGIDAGLDQFGGVEDAAVLAGVIRSGQVSEARIDESVRRIMRQKFALGLFERPFVDPERAARLVNSVAFRQRAEAAQRQALVLLENRNALLPLTPEGKPVFLHGVRAQAARALGFDVVESVDQAELAIIRISAPFELLHPNYVFGRMQHEGDLAFDDGNADYEIIKAASARVPTIVSVYLDRPAILTNVRDKAHALIADFGVNDAALLQVIAGQDTPRGRLPFELPSSMEAVLEQAPDLPFDSENALYPFGYGLQYRPRIE